MNYPKSKLDTHCDNGSENIPSLQTRIKLSNSLISDKDQNETLDEPKNYEDKSKLTTSRANVGNKPYVRNLVFNSLSRSQQIKANYLSSRQSKHQTSSSYLKNTLQSKNISSFDGGMDYKSLLMNIDDISKLKKIQKAKNLLSNLQQ